MLSRQHLLKIKKKSLNPWFSISNRLWSDSHFHIHSRLKKFLSNFRNNYNDFNQDSVRNSNFKLKNKQASSLDSLKHEETQNSYIKRTFLSPQLKSN